jgi:hypothetical protein
MTELTDLLVMMRAFDISFIAYTCPVFFFCTLHTLNHKKVPRKAYLPKASTANYTLVAEIAFTLIC